MPILSAFFGVLIRVNNGDHNPPHLHVEYAEYKALVKISSGAIIKGKLPPRVHGLVKEWLKLRRREVLKAWNEAKAFNMPKRIKPLE